LFTLSVSVARMLSSSGPSSSESSSLLSSSSLQLESTKSHLPLLMSPFNALPLLRRFNCSFFGNTAYERYEPKQPTITLQLLSWCSLRQEVRHPVDESVLSFLHNGILQRLHLKDVRLYYVSPFLFKYFLHTKQLCWMDFPTLRPLLYCLSVNLYRESPSLLVIRSKVSPGFNLWGSRQLRHLILLQMKSENCKFPFCKSNPVTSRPLTKPCLHHFIECLHWEPLLILL
jgi:hypothetical protein